MNFVWLGVLAMFGVMAIFAWAGMTIAEWTLRVSNQGARDARLRTVLRDQWRYFKRLMRSL